MNKVSAYGFRAIIYIKFVVHTESIDACGNNITIHVINKKICTVT